MTLEMGHKTTYFRERPSVIISVGDVCNYKCVMCFNPLINTKRKFITDTMFYRTFDMCMRHKIVVDSIGSIGEPLLHKNFMTYQRYAKSNGMPCTFATNCSLLYPDITDELIKDGSGDQISLSMYSSNASEHKMYTGTSTFEQTYENVKYFLKTWSSSGRKMKVKFGFLPLQGINDYTQFMNVWHPLTESVGLKIEIKNAGNWGTAVSGFKNEFELNYPRRCPELNYFLIHHDGKIGPCHVMHGEDAIFFGDINSDDIMDVWSSEKYNNFKNAHYAKKVALYKKCQNCSDRFLKIPLHPKLLFRKVLDRLR